MNQVIQGESSGGPSGLPLKRRRGRPRKNPSLKHPESTRTLPGFGGVKEHVPQRANNAVGIDYMVGQAVTGVVEATFEAGYLLTVKIGNSSTNLRGVVFKPGHYVPITADNDVVPHVQMIRRNSVHLPAENQGRSHGQTLAMQTVTNNTPEKRKYTKLAPSVPPVDVRCQVSPVVIEPIGLPNETPNSNLMGSTAPRTGDKSVHTVEPISMLPPDKSVQVSQIFVTTQPQRVTEVSMQNLNDAFNENTSEAEQGDETKSMRPTDSDSAGSSESSDGKTENGNEASKASEDLGTVSKPETGNNVEPFPVDPMQTTPIGTSYLFRFGTGRMTELLQAVQENMKDNKVPMAEQPIPASEVEFHQTGMTETNAENEARAP